MLLDTPASHEYCIPTNSTKTRQHRSSYLNFMHEKIRLFSTVQRRINRKRSLSCHKHPPPSKIAVALFSLKLMDIFFKKIVPNSLQTLSRKCWPWVLIANCKKCTVNKYFKPIPRVFYYRFLGSVLKFSLYKSPPFVSDAE